MGVSQIRKYGSNLGVLIMGDRRGLLSGRSLVVVIVLLLFGAMVFKIGSDWGEEKTSQLQNLFPPQYRNESEQAMYESILEQIEKADYCAYADDCIDLWNNTPFPCHIIINKAKITEIQSLIEKYPYKPYVNCGQQPLPSSELLCTTGKCSQQKYIE